MVREMSVESFYSRLRQSAAAASQSPLLIFPSTSDADSLCALKIVLSVLESEQLKLTHPNSEVLFLGRPDSMESAAIAAAGFDFAPITAAKLSRPKLSFKNLNLPYNLVKSTLQSLSELREFGPDVVIGTGGYVSVPTCLASAFLRRPLVIHEQNSVPGIANWALSFIADAVLVAFEFTVGCFPAAGKCTVVGNPVRVWAREGFSRAAAVRRFFPRAAVAVLPEVVVVVVLGGSLGALNLNFFFSFAVDSGHFGTKVVACGGRSCSDELELAGSQEPRQKHFCC